MSDVEENNIDKKLYGNWTFWCMESSREKTRKWDDFLKNLNTVSSVVEFWQTLNYLKLPCRLENGMDYYFFRDGIKPTWEDPANSSGGAWSITIRKTRDVDQFWINTLIALIGEQFVDAKGQDFCDLIKSRIC